MKTFTIIIILLLMSIGLASAQGRDFEGTKALIESGIACDGLSEEQLEAIGDYFMEQMHPGEAHELMDERMGGEGSENLRQVHINMARRFYCTEGSMMGAMMAPMGGESMEYGMMGTGMVSMWLLGLLYIAIASFVFGIIFWHTYKLVVGREKHKEKYKKR
ncbi:MAG: hypothetical protein ACE5DM_01535 [Candidatus Nanoarchaeia archaeon]